MFTGLSIIIGVGLILIGFAVYRAVNNMSADPTVVHRPDLTAEITAAVDSRVAAFITAIGFRFANAYQFHAIRLGHWEQAGNHPPLRRFSVSLSRSGTNYEFITEFSDDHSLTTTRTRAAFMLPRRFGCFLQSFPSASIEHLWNLHLQGEQYVISNLSIPLKECRVSFLDGFGPAILRQMHYVKSLPLWPVRGIYWFLVKRFLMTNRPIWTQNVSKLYRQTA